MFREPDANLVKLGPDPVSQTNVSDPDLSFLNKFETDLKKSNTPPPPNSVYCIRNLIPIQT